MALLVDGQEAFARIIDRIRSAERTIVINMFIWRDDKIGNTMAQELLKAADRGVNIHIVKDKLGEVFEKAEETKQSFFHKEFSLVSWLKAAVVDLMYPMRGKAKNARQRPNPLADSLVRHSHVSVNHQTLRGDHSKYYIFDDRVIIMGGMNIEDKELYTDAEGKRYNDYMVELVGQAYVEQFRRRLCDGTRFDERNPIDFIINARRNNRIDYEAKGKILEILSSAKVSIDIIMAYIGDDEIADKIIECANRGVTISLLLPGKANIQQDTNLKVLKRILTKTHNRVHAYLSNNMVHAKLIRIDNRLVTFGSTNLNRQAMEQLLELNVIIKNYDHDFSQTLEQSIQRNISTAIRVSDPAQIHFNQLKAALERLV